MSEQRPERFVSSIGENPVIRIAHRGRPYRWQRVGSAWPGHTMYVAIGTNEVILGDRYADEGLEQTYTCHPRALIDGCFHAIITKQFGPDILDEVLAEVRSVAYLPETTERARQPARSPKPAPADGPAAERAEKPAGETAAESGSEPARDTSGSPEVSRPVTSGRVSVSLIGVETVDMALAAALRVITRAPLEQLLAQLEHLPIELAVDIPAAAGEAMKQRLARLGATARTIRAE